MGTCPRTARAYSMPLIPKQGTHLEAIDRCAGQRPSAAPIYWNLQPLIATCCLGKGYHELDWEWWAKTGPGQYLAPFWLVSISPICLLLQTLVVVRRTPNVFVAQIIRPLGKGCKQAIAELDFYGFEWYL